MFDSDAAREQGVKGACINVKSQRISSGDSNPANANPRLNWGVNAAKRTMDVCGACVLLFLLFPVLLIIALLVKRDHGNALYGHPRIGRGGRTFKCLKFRSMVMDSDAVLAKLLASDPQTRAEWDRDFKLKNDIRITPVGRFLRKSSLDELPQLWNVLRGDMSLVGPRPIVEKELSRYGHNVHYYLALKPGITGLWQVSGRNDVDYATRVSLDVKYATNRSLAFDVWILLRTVGVVFAKNGAY